MTDFEREDLELKELMGDKFIDKTNPIYIQHEEKEETVTFGDEVTFSFSEKKIPTKGTPKADPSWHPKKERNWIDGLKGCVKWALTFGGLNMLIFYWQQAGLMAESIAVPCMWVCCALAGYGVGLNAWRFRK